MLAYPSLKSGYTMRVPTAADVPAIIEVIKAMDLAETGEADTYEVHEILADWEDLSIEHDLRVALAPDGTLCGYCALYKEKSSGRLVADGYVHPQHYGNGIGTTLIEFMEQRARSVASDVPEGTRVVLVNNIVASSPAARALLESRDYTLTRVYFRMHITLTTQPELPLLPEDLTIRTCVQTEEDYYHIYEAVEESFKDHWGHAPKTYDEWKRYMINEDFNPSLWFILQDGDQIAGVALCRNRQENRGWITQLAVRRPWRKRGLGKFLLRYAFHTFYQRGLTRIGLGVDGQSLTGANRLYEHVGMSITMQIGRYEQELRPGHDLLTDH